MKMKSTLKRWLSAFMMMTMILASLFSMNVNAEEEDDLDQAEMNLDVVFVLDASGSMLEADPNGIARDAFNLFVDLCDESCSVGYDVYTEKIKASHSIVSLKDKKNLQEVKKEMSAIRYDPNGDTDIALGLTKAMNIFTEYGNKDSNRKKAIVLLSDGNTHLINGPRTVAESKKEMETTLKSLNAKNIPVYSIGLNYDKKLDKKELENISGKTNGKSYETNTSEQLTWIISDIFSDVYGLEGVDKEIKDGKVDINIKDSSVFYVNIIVRSKLRYEDLSPELIDPDGKAVSLTEDTNVKLTRTNSYTLIKMIYPKSGIWTLNLNSATNDNCSVKQLDFYSVYVKQNVKTKTDYSGQIEIEATLNDGDGVVTDQDLLDTIEMTAKISTKSGTTEVPLLKTDDGVYFGDFKPEEEGEYTIQTVAVSPKFRKSSRSAKMTVGKSEDTPSVSGEAGKKPVEVEEDFFQKIIIFIIVIIVAIILVVLVLILIGVIRTRSQNSLINSLRRDDEPKFNSKPRPARQDQQASSAPAPDYVDVTLVEHDKIENLIKRGTDDAFANKKAEDYETDKSLEAIIKKGTDDPFNRNAEDYEVDPALAALIKTGSNGAGTKNSAKNKKLANNKNAVKLNKNEERKPAPKSQNTSTPAAPNVSSGFVGSTPVNNASTTPSAPNVSSGFVGSTPVNNAPTTPSAPNVSSGFVGSSSDDWDKQ